MTISQFTFVLLNTNMYKFYCACFLFIVTALNDLGSCFQIHNITHLPYDLIESPVWSPQEKALYWVNAFEQSVFRLDEETGDITTRYINHGEVLAIALIRNHSKYLLVAVRTGIFLLKWGASGGDEALKLLTKVDVGKPGNSIDSLQVDAAGRLWIGTVGKYDPELTTQIPLEEATLYSMDFNEFKHPVVRKRPVTMGKGIVWSLDDTKMYFNDGFTRNITAFDYDLATGNICNESVIFNFADHGIPGFPDGMTLDAHDNLWVATFSPLILNINPRTGKLIRLIELPVDRITSMRWSGPSTDELYVTTSKFNVPHPKPLSGTLLKLTDLGTSGFPDYQFEFPDASNY